MRRASSAIALLLGAAALPGLGGCARGESAEERAMAQLREELGRVQQASERMEERLAVLEIQAAESRQKRPPPTAPPPPPRVVQLGHADPRAPVVDDPDDGTPRPTIRVTGSAQGAKGRPAPPVIEQTIPDEGSGPSVGGAARKPSALDPRARKDYDDALALVRAKKYDQGLEALGAFLLRWPDHPYAENATYWRGECYFAKGELPQAVEQFEGVIARWPLGNKVPDAMLKLGLSYQKLQSKEKARAWFDRLRRDFPKSEAAGRIPQENP
jgi:tol-pal system protein YbgF